MVDRCKLCGDKIEEEEHKEKKVCHSCLHKGFLKLTEVIGRMKDSEDG